LYGAAFERSIQASIGIEEVPGGHPGDLKPEQPGSTEG
jgi:hypothetical protein